MLPTFWTNFSRRRTFGARRDLTSFRPCYSMVTPCSLEPIGPFQAVSRLEGSLWASDRALAKRNDTFPCPALLNKFCHLGFEHYEQFQSPLFHNPHVHWLHRAYRKNSIILEWLVGWFSLWASPRCHAGLSPLLAGQVFVVFLLIGQNDFGWHQRERRDDFRSLRTVIHRK